MFDRDASEDHQHSTRQLSLAGLFLLTLIAALILTIGRVLGPFWCITIAITLFALRMPSQSVNPIIQGVAMFAVTLGLLAGLAYWMKVHPVQAVIPCCIIPGLCYVVGFTKALELEQ